MKTSPHHLAVLAFLPVLAGCAPADPLPAPRCDPAQHQALVGQNIGAVTLPAELPQRVISPGEPVTEDYNPARLNIFVDPKGWIARITCG